MNARIDHIVLWVADPLRSLEFFEQVLGFEGVRADEFRAGRAPFPSVRVAADAVFDLAPMTMAPALNGFPGADGSAGNRVNHVCLAMTKADYDALRGRLEARGLATPFTMKDSFGAQGRAPEACYFRDPDGNIFEARYYA